MQLSHPNVNHFVTLGTRCYATTVLRHLMGSTVRSCTTSTKQRSCQIQPMPMQCHVGEACTFVGPLVCDLCPQSGGLTPHQLTRKDTTRTDNYEEGCTMDGMRQPSRAAITTALALLGFFMLPGLTACNGGTHPAIDLGIGNDTGSPLVPCDSSIPKTQSLSQPCCQAYGIDACGAGLFCAAFDGRTQATCYAEHARMDQETCGEDVQCLSSSCNLDVGKCRSTPQTSCTQEVGCAPDPTGRMYTCGSGGTCTITGSAIYSHCTQGADCDAGLQCAAVGVRQGAAGSFCTTQLCQDGNDAPCQSPLGTGKCFVLTTTPICLLTCTTNSECPAGSACNIQVGACFSACQSDADCASGFVCDPGTSAAPDRRTCLAAS
jgi:hypothetical protein